MLRFLKIFHGPMSSKERPLGFAFHKTVLISEIRHKRVEIFPKLW